MIKEKRDNGNCSSEGAGPPSNTTFVKEEPLDSPFNKNIGPADSNITTKKEDDPPGSSCSVKKENLTGRLSTNGTLPVIGSTNTGSLPENVDRKPTDNNCTTEGSSDDHTCTDEPHGNSGGSCSVTVKTEDPGPDLGPDSYGGVGGSLSGTIGMSGRPQNAPDGVQPLPSNVIHKQTSSMELQYMQQQSQIFVFSTTMANKGAESVLHGNYPSIIAYHCAQPGTKKYLEKHPLKITQFNRQNPAQWLNNLAMMKNKGALRSQGMGPMHKGLANIGSFHPHDEISHGDGLPWDHNTQLDGLDGLSNGEPLLQSGEGGLDVPPLDGLIPGSPHRPLCLSSSEGLPPMGQSPGLTSTGSGSPSLANLQPSLQGVKVPDENLTPTQRQHREEQLATIRKMHQMLFPEQGPGDHIKGPLGILGGTMHSNLGPMPDMPMRGPHPAPGGHMPGNMGPRPMGPGISCPMDSQVSGSMLDSPMGCGPVHHNSMMGPNMMGCNMGNMPPSMMGGMGGMCNPVGPMVGLGGGMPNMINQKPNLMGPGGTHTVAAQIEWQKLQSQFYEDRKGVKGSLDLGSPMSGGSGPGTANRANMRTSQGPRSQGPPPPYHQTPRSASVPIATQSPNPASPNNPTSNLSLPSPRGGSALNSPAEPSRQFSGNSHKHSGGLGSGQSPSSQDSPAGRPLNPSNPGTPISSHMSPSASMKDIDIASANSSHQPDGMFGRTLQVLAQQKGCQPQGPPKEPNLMPVPSPQQIQYLNTFEGQELTIQKQPNTSLKDSNMISPSILPTSMDGGFTGIGSGPVGNDTRVSGPSTPLTPLESRFPIPQSPQTPGSTPTSSGPNTGEKNARIAGPGRSPQGSQGSRTPVSESSKNQSSDGPRFSESSPSSGLPFSTTTQPGLLKMGNFMDMSPGKNLPSGSGDATPVSSVFSCGRADNMPLNPNTNMSTGVKPSHFDPISSLAQMSQQLTNSVSALNGQPGPPSGMMPFNPHSHPMMMGSEMGSCGMDGSMQNIGPIDGPCNMGSMGMGLPYSSMQNPNQMIHTTSAMSVSPKLGNPMVSGPPNPFPVTMGPRMMGRTPGPSQIPYNGANIQVKASAPNTIQYLPARPQSGNSNPRGPPSLDFLQRFANPMNSMDMKGPGPNMQYYTNCGQGQNMNMNCHMDGGPMNEPPMGSIMGIPSPDMMGPVGGMVMRGMRPPGNLIRMPSHMGNVYNGPSNGGDPMFAPGPNMPNPNMSVGPNAQLFVLSSKSSPMGMNAPDASQPLPPSMGQGTNYKSSPYIGPTTTDPNYAQQFHNFQQQLYATSTRSQLGQTLPSNQYFVPK